MSKAKYQIFVSSTYSDLKEERELVIQTILEMGYIPAGLEMLSAREGGLWMNTTSQIESSSYFVLILANRYGSTTSDGISYVEREYDYAVSIGIPVLCFLKSHDTGIENVQPEDETARQKLQNFRQKVFARTIRFFNNKEDLRFKFIVELTNVSKTTTQKNLQTIALLISTLTARRVFNVALAVLTIAFTTSIIYDLIKGTPTLDTNFTRFAHYISGRFDNQNFAFVALAVSFFGGLLVLIKSIYDNLQGKINSKPEHPRPKPANVSRKFSWASSSSSELTSNDLVDKVNRQRAAISTLKARLLREEKDATKVDIKSKESINQIISGDFDAVRNRLTKEISKIESRGLLSLVIGITTTLAAITVLIVSIVYTPKTSVFNELLLYYIPKVSFSLFVEIFAFFFLRLYRFSLIDIKYYQNELTNIDMKSVSLKVLSLQEGQETLAQVCADISKTERNGILKEAESLNTTMSAKNETSSDKYFNGIIQSLIDKIPKADGISGKAE